MIHEELRAAYFDKVMAFATAEGLALALPNMRFEKPKRDKYFLQAYNLPIEPIGVTVCGESRRRWILQIDVCAREAIGDTQSMEYVDKIHDSLFPIHSKMVTASHNFQVVSPPNPAPSILDDAWYHTPVSLTVEAIH